MRYPSGALRLANKLLRSFFGREEMTALNRAAAREQVDLMWFPTPAFEWVGMPYLYTVWDLQHRSSPFFPEVSKGRLWDFKEEHYSAIIPRAAYTLTGTAEGKREIAHYYRVRNERIKIVPLPTPDIPESTCSGTDTRCLNINRPYLFYPAQFWPHKNHVALLYTLKILVREEHLDFELVFTGSDQGNLDYVRSVAENIGIVDRVHFLGFVDKRVLGDLYRNAFALVFPSFFGPDNLPPLEAFAVGCPVITARVPGSEEQLGDAALLVDPGDERQIVHHVRRLLNEEGLRESLIERGKIRSAGWTAKEYLNSVMQIIDEFESFRRCWDR